MWYARKTMFLIAGHCGRWPVTKGCNSKRRRLNGKLNMSKQRKRTNAGASTSTAALRRKVFVEAYLSNGGNATQAAISAGYSESSARRQGYRMTTDVHILAELDKRRTEICNKLEISTERILQERARLAFFDARKLFDSTGAPIPIHELDDDTAAALAGLEVLEQYEGTGNDRVFVGYVKKYKLSLKTDSLTALEKHLGMYEKDNRQKNPFEELPRDVLKAIQDKLQGLKCHRY